MATDRQFRFGAMTSQKSALPSSATAGGDLSTEVEKIAERKPSVTAFPPPTPDDPVSQTAIKDAVGRMADAR